MMAPLVERRLAAILAADVVGYSRLIEADEAGTLRALRAMRQDVLEPLLAEHRGRIAKLMGDGIIVEFGSVVSAVACAAALQERLATAQGDVTPGRLYDSELSRLFAREDPLESSVVEV
jgi:adenylate cyclase